ncbi:MAG: hypothetical protein A3J62_03385 [Candidatus Buchananbacteria bacterium RIFCSPHIGHO2_02_FULL_38_8]|uniref:PEP-utilising enzyme mobile domain-containing protein n=2 Tax=Candidatus Buchananiibacteriota TaxID=1817903 RepID=A0A1G1XUZ7_9BACT|nr:MAG: hypothetical protein A2731_03470 [Candidatus Buchananbacteria bacterium RIFCSPHIGHO2_01_FULL_39_8]OGY47039.1 MAG: hypothetical protein A3J62_03385 [Candidatus Buchananbacteria bacterium RIFCSPHIGHO2_02_FULL_38_8]
MKINIDPQGELFKWGPIDGKLIYPDFFNVAFVRFQKAGFKSWPDVLWLASKEKMLCVLDNNNLYECGRKNFIKFILVDNQFKKFYQSWRNSLKKFLTFKKEISPEKLKRLTIKQLVDFYQQWVKYYLGFWTVGELPEVANWGGEIILKEKLKKLVPADNFIYIFERLSAPVNLSFYQKAEFDLLKLKEFSKRPKLFKQKIDIYQKKYFWILNSYHHTRVLDQNYFKKELATYSFKKAQAKIKELGSHNKRIRQEKDLIIRNYHLGAGIRKIVERLTFCIWWQDLRKYYIFLANHQIDLFLKEFSHRYKLDFESLHYYNVSEIFELIEVGKRLGAKEIKRRRLNLVVHYSEKFNQLNYISGIRAKKIIALYTTLKVDRGTKEFKGLVVSQGKVVRGRVRILTSTANFSEMKKGEILVASMTSPDYITAIKKAAAIITDEGGMTCHAAIVSRELRIPCIVGTKIATKVLKNGDIVNINTNQGIISLVKRKIK